MAESILDQTSDRRAGNALKTGIYARKLLLVGEEASALETLRESLVEDWRPRSVTEWLLVDQIARLQWRLLRVEEAECAKLETMQRKPKYGQVDQDKPYPVEQALANDLVRHDSGLQRMQVFQMRIERAIHRTISQLLILRKSRRRKIGKLQHQRARKISPQLVTLPQVVANTQNEICGNKPDAPEPAPPVPTVAPRAERRARLLPTTTTFLAY